MKELFLTSGGLVDEVKEDFLKLLNKNPRETLLVFIPTASDPEINKDFVSQDIDLIKKIGLKMFVIDLKEENKDSLLEKLGKCDVIYVEGGNTFYLLDWVRKSGFDKVVGQLLDNGKIYVGMSAGSIIAGPDIESAGWEGVGTEPDKNIVNLKDLRGMDLVPFVVSPHFVENDREGLSKGSRNVNYPIIAISDKQAILVEGDKWKIIGEGEKIIYNELGIRNHELWGKFLSMLCLIPGLKNPLSK